MTQQTASVVPITAGIGHNNPPTDVEILQANLAEKYQEIRANTRDLCSQANAAVPKIQDEDQAGIITDLIKEITKCDKALDSHRTHEKEFYLASGRAVDGFFNKGRDLLGAAKKNLSDRLTAWQNQKAAEERARRAEAERIAAEALAAAQAAALALEKAGQTTEATAQLEQAVVAEQVAYKAQVAAEAKPAHMTRAYGSSTGAVASLRTVWVGELVDRAALDLEALRTHFTEEAIQKAINSFVKTGTKELRGARIFEKSESVVR